MADQPIKSSELIADGVFNDAIKGANDWLRINKELEDQLTTNLNITKEFLANSRVNSSKALEDQAKAAKAAADELAALEKVQQESIKVEQLKLKLQQEAERLEQQRIKTARDKSKQEQQYNKEIEDQAKALEKANKANADANSVYTQSVKRLAAVKKELKELQITGKTNTEEFRRLSSEFRNLDTSVRSAEQSVGEFQRSVGEYPTVFGEVQDSLSGIGSAVLAAFSVETVIDFGKKILETRAEFQKYEAVLTNTLGSKSQATKTLERIADFASKTPFGVAEVTESFVKLANQGFKPTNKELTKLGDLASSQGKTFDQLTEGIIDAQAGEFERLKEFGIRASKEGDKVTFTFKEQKTEVKNTASEINKYILGLGELQGVSGGMAAISETLNGKISNLGDGFDAFFNNLGKNTQGVFASVLDGLNDIIGASNDAQNVLTKITATLTDAKVELSFSEKLFGGNAQLTAVQLKLNEINREGRTFSEIARDYEFAQKALVQQLIQGEISLTDYKNSNILLNAAIKATSEEIDAGNVVKEKDNELTKEQIKLAKELAKANKDAQNQLIKLRIDNTQLDERRDRDQAENENRLAKEALKDSKAKADTKRKIEVELDIKLQQQLIDIRDKYAKERRDKEEKERKEEQDKAIKDEVDFQKRLKIVDVNANPVSDRINKELKDREDKRKKDLQDAVKTSELLLDIVAKEVAESAKLRQEALDKEIADKQDAIDIQRSLAERGQANTLAFEEEEKRKLELQREQDKQQEIKRQKVLAFFKLFASYAEKDPNKALQNALRDTVLAEAVAGAFFKGTEKVEDDLQDAKLHNGRDGYRIAVDGKERILTGKQNEMVGGLSNDELAKLAFDHRTGSLDYARYTAIPVEASYTKEKDNALLTTMSNVIVGIQSLEQVIKDKPVHTWELNKHGEFVNKVIEGAFIKQKTFKIKPPRIV